MDVVENVLSVSGFKELNPPQQMALDAGLLDGKSLVVAAPTASGKTLIAEFAALNTINKGGKVVYIVPLKALASEKHDEFREKYSKQGVKVGITTGDLDSTDSWLANYDIIITTSEKFDSLLRHGIPWLDQVRLVVVDEIHLLNDPSRGPTLEMVITRLRQFVDPVILALSATINNYQELADWLGAGTVKSDFRPVSLYRGICFEDKINFIPQREMQLTTKNSLVEITKDTLQKNKQTLIFVSTRRSTETTAENLGHTVQEKTGTSMDRDNLAAKILKVLDHPTKQCERLARCVKSGSAFHHAGLTSAQRKMIEQGFKSGLIKIITATPTLAAGINLPAYRVVVRDLKRFSSIRGMDYLPNLEVEQMMGRCVDGETILIKEDGEPVSINEIASNYFKNYETGKKKLKNDINILSVDLETYMIKPAKITHIWKRTSSDLIEIETTGGKRIITTKDHPFLVFRKGLSGKPRTIKNDKSELYKKVTYLRDKFKYGPDRIVNELGVPEYRRMIEHWIYDKSKPSFHKCVEWKLSKDIKNGRSFKTKDHIASAKSFHFKAKLAPPNSYLDMSQIVRKKNNTYMTLKGHKSNKFPSKWSVNLCRFIAKIMSDGNIYYNRDDNSYQIRYYNKNKSIHDEYAKICFQLFGKRLNTSWRRGSYGSSFKSFIVGNFLKNIGVPSGKKSIILRIPKILFQLPETLLRSFVLEYSRCDGYETPFHYVLVTCSEKLAYDFSLLLSKIGIIARVSKKKPNKIRNRYAWEISFTKSQFNQNKKLCSVGCLHPDLIKNIKTIKVEKHVYDITLNSEHNFIANGLIVHNSGRPSYDTEGEAILMTKSKPEAQYAWDNYIKGEPEKIYSKLGVEPVLRTHVLALISSGITPTKKDLFEFFSKTFYAHQYKDLTQLNFNLEKVLTMLEKQKFIAVGGDKKDLDEFSQASDMMDEDVSLKPSRIGKRVAELYIDPITANTIIEGLSKMTPSHVNIIQLLCNCLEMRPLLNLRKADYDNLYSFLAGVQEDLLTKPPNEWDFEYEEYLRAIKTIQMFNSWTEEEGENKLMETYHVAPGELRVRLDNADWLLYATQELGLLMGLMDTLKHVRKTRLRVKYGVKEELLPLIKLKGVGRARARRLYDSKIRSPADIRNTPLESLSRLLGPKTAEDVKKQV